MKIKYVLKSKADFQKWITIGNVFAKSLCPVNEVLKQYNNLTASQRMAIKKQFLEYDDIRRKKIPKKEKINNMLNVAFNRAKSKNYFIYGIILFICCLFFRYNVYYIIFSSLMFCFSLFSRFNRKYNKPKLKTIDIVSETLKQ